LAFVPKVFSGQSTSANQSSLVVSGINNHNGQPSLIAITLPVGLCIDLDTKKKISRNLISWF
jgi:hypothetical protein